LSFPLLLTLFEGLDNGIVFFAFGLDIPFEIRDVALELSWERAFPISLREAEAGDLEVATARVSVPSGVELNLAWIEASQLLGCRIWDNRHCQRSSPSVERRI
jgi:hypothetical protein